MAAEKKVEVKKAAKKEGIEITATKVNYEPSELVIKEMMIQRNVDHDTALKILKENHS